MDLFIYNVLVYCTRATGRVLNMLGEVIRWFSIQGVSCSALFR